MSSSIKALYRRAIRITPRLEGERRRRLFLFRAKEMLGAAMCDRTDSTKLEQHLMSADIYVDQIEAQAGHLHNLGQDSSKLLVPIELYTAEHQRSVTKSNIMLESMPGVRRAKHPHNHSKDALVGRLFQGPEPSWLRKKGSPASDTESYTPVPSKRR